jgi:hypothetical protein
LLALARKYRLLSDLRRGALPPARETLLPLAREFPGALRELDILPLHLLDRRLHAVLDAERGATPEPWIEWMLAYHERMRLALRAKALLRGAGADDPTLIAQIESELRLEASAPCQAEFVARVARPPRGRLNSLVFETLEQELGLPPNELEQTLFPSKSRA